MFLLRPTAVVAAGLFVCLVATQMALGATSDPLRIPRFDAAEVDIQVDGELNESVWSRVHAYDEMTVVQPDTREPGVYRTETLLFYTERGLYVGVRAFQPAETLVEQLSPRDQFLSRDGYQLIVDPSGEGRYAYWFFINVGGSLGDGTVLPERDFQRNWDGPWTGDAIVTKDGWSGEMFLPWSMMNMPKGDADGTRRMGIYGSRRVAHRNERWSWPALPETQPKFLSAFQPIQLDDVSPTLEYSIFPYVSAAYDIGHQKTIPKAGVDMFFRPTANMQLTAALNPDFGQVEADDVVVNLSALETFFPEKRLFFLENQEIFVTSPRANADGPGGRSRGLPTTLVNTRRIGASIINRRGTPDIPDDVTLDSFESLQPADLLGAIKVAGQREAFRYGALAAFEDDERIAVDLPDAVRAISAKGRQFGVFRGLHEQVQGGGRRAIGMMGTVVEHPERRAFTGGVDGHWLTTDGQWTLDGQLLASDVDAANSATGQGFGGFVDARFQPSRGIQHRLGLEYFDDSLEINDLGFLSRNDVIGVNYNFGVDEHDVGWLKQRDTFYGVESKFNSDGRLIDGGLFVRSRWELNDNSRFFGGIAYQPERWDDINSLGNGAFKVRQGWQAELNWNSDFSRPVVYQAGIDVERESLAGTRRRYRGEVIYRPISSVSIRFELRYADRDGWLVHQGDRAFTGFSAEEWQPRLNVDAFFPHRQQVQLSLQWVGVKAEEARFYAVPAGDGALQRVAKAPDAASDSFAISDLSLQLRYRWEIAPLSDLFIVYNRGGRHPETNSRGFTTLFADGLSDPFAEALIVKLRYRLGS